MAVIALSCWATPAPAFQVRSDFSVACHESITLGAYNGILDDVDISRVPLPQSDVWRKLAAQIQKVLGVTFDSPQQELIAVSLVIGARWPDLRGHSVANFVQIRDANLNPDGQYVHCLRAPDDDFEQGNINAVEGTKDWIRQQVAAAQASLERPQAEQIVKTNFYLDFYGEFKVEVWEPAFRLAIAAHAIEDSFTHSLRSADTMKIHTVLNYVDPVNGIVNEERDGLGHSDSIDDCADNGPSRELAESARDAVEDFFTAARIQYREGDQDAVDAMLVKWMTLEPGCTKDNDYCDSPWLEVAKEELSGPYLCNASLASLTNPWRQIVLPWTLIIVAMFFWRRRWSARLLGWKA